MVHESVEGAYHERGDKIFRGTPIPEPSLHAVPGNDAVQERCIIAAHKIDQLLEQRKHLQNPDKNESSVTA
jgi:hypothetical protein